MNKEAFLLLVNKFLSGKTSPEEDQLLLNYFESFQQATAWNEDELGPKDELESKLLDRLQAALPAPKRAVVARFNRRIAVAAAVLVVGVSGWLLRNQFVRLFKTPQPLQEIVTRFQERRQVKLEDGTEIWMEPGSRLSYPLHFEGDNREVSLAGGAFFEVTKNPARPFIIHTGTISTRVLGTSFNVKAYEPSTQEVALVTGWVIVKPEGKTANDTAQVVLSPNQVVAWNESEHRLEKSVLRNTAYYAQRRFGKFIYEGETIATVLDDIRHQYNVHVELNSPASECTFYGDFDVHQDVSKVLNVLAATLNAKVKKDSAANTWIISGGGCASPKL